MPTEAYALCPRRPMPYARRVPHVTEKGYIPQISELTGLFEKSFKKLKLS